MINLYVLNRNNKPVYKISTGMTTLAAFRANLSRTAKSASFLIIFAFSLTLFSQEISFPAWTHISIDAILPGSSWGTGGPATWTVMGIQI